MSNPTHVPDYAEPMRAMLAHMREHPAAVCACGRDLSAEPYRIRGGVETVCSAAAIADYVTARIVPNVAGVMLAAAFGLTLEQLHANVRAHRELLGLNPNGTVWSHAAVRRMAGAQ